MVQLLLSPFFIYPFCYRFLSSRTHLFINLLTYALPGTKCNLNFMHQLLLVKIPTKINSLVSWLAICYYSLYGTENTRDTLHAKIILRSWRKCKNTFCQTAKCLCLQQPSQIGTFRQNHIPPLHIDLII